MMEKVKLMLANWKTTGMGLLTLLCASDSTLHFLPESMEKYLLASCGFFIAIGLIAAKDSDKSNAETPSATAVTVK